MKTKKSWFKQYIQVFFGSVNKKRKLKNQSYITKQTFYVKYMQWKATASFCIPLFNAFFLFQDFPIYYVDTPKPLKRTWPDTLSRLESRRWKKTNKKNKKKTNWALLANRVPLFLSVCVCVYLSLSLLFLDIILSVSLMRGFLSACLDLIMTIPSNKQTKNLVNPNHPQILTAKSTPYLAPPSQTILPSHSQSVIKNLLMSLFLASCFELSGQFVIFF